MSRSMQVSGLNISLTITPLTILTTLLQILTTTSREEQLEALQFLRSTTAGTALIHESVDVDDPSTFVSSR